MAQQNDHPAGGQQGSAGDDDAQSLFSGETADNEGFHAGRPGPDDAEPEAGPGAPGNDPATGGPEDPTNAEQNPAGQDDTDQNPPLPRTWN